MTEEQSLAAVLKDLLTENPEHLFSDPRTTLAIPFYTSPKAKNITDALLEIARAMREQAMATERGAKLIANSNIRIAEVITNRKKW